MTCPSCGSENPAGQKYCGECGSPLALACPSCSAPAQPGQKFCGECGTALVTDRYKEGSAAAGAAATRAEPEAERRLVSVLFADLVGFTTLSEARDAEEVRELLSRYFDTCRRLIELYGGVVEKFIGDAVMAVWGTPTATEDDAERAVRAGLDLVSAVAALGEEFGTTELRLRAGVLTGEAAVTLGAEGQGMVAGDLVNTAARIQSEAEPGTVLVGEATKRASELTIVYEDAGSHELKGKAEPVPLHRALRVASGRRGALKSTGIEPPFVGRDRELRLVKELFHASADEHRPHLVSVFGIAGIGKSRLAWEFYKYFDGLAENVYFHRGRCLAYGDGVTYWALADMVRMRARIAEDESTESALSKLEATLSEHILDDEERHFIAPRLAHLLGLGEEEEVSHNRQDLFAAWRLFFERLAGTYPTVMVFEDMQWADASLLDFVEYLLEWSRSSPLYVLTLARPELLERRPNWGAGHRNFTSLHLDPLSGPAMSALLDGFAPGLPEPLRGQILTRAEGIPLYAVETVRMLLDRGLLAQEGAVYRPTGEVAELDVPETLHGLIASRLDGLPAEERRLLQDAAVVGKTFTPQAVAAVSGLEIAEVEPVLGALARKEVLGVQADPTSPEHGQYGFLQDLVRHVAYETLSRRERRSRHLAAAAYLERAFPGEDEIAEVVSSHYLDAYDAVPDADDADEVKAQAAAALVRAGDRADSLGAAGEALRYLERAAGLTDDPRARAELLSRSGWLGVYIADYATSERLFGEAIALYESLGDAGAAARVSGRLAQVESYLGRYDQALPRAEAAFAVVSGDEPSEGLVELACVLSGGYFFSGDLERALEMAERAMTAAESLGEAEPLSKAFSAKALCIEGKRPQEQLALLRQSLAIAREHDLAEREANILFNLSDHSFQRDRYDDALEYLRQSLTVVRRRGNRPHEWAVLAETTYPLFMLGRWDEALDTFEQVPAESRRLALTTSFLSSVLEIMIHRGDVAGARELLAEYEDFADATDIQDRSIYLAASAVLDRAEGRLQEALAAGSEVARIHSNKGGFTFQATKQVTVEAVEAALACGEVARAEELIASVTAVPPGLRSQYLVAHAERFRARMAEGEEADEAAANAVKRFRELRIPFWLAVTLLERAERGDDGESLAEAHEIFEALQAAPWLERVTAAEAGRPTAAASGVP